MSRFSIFCRASNEIHPFLLLASEPTDEKYPAHHRFRQYGMYAHDPSDHTSTAIVDPNDAVRFCLDYLRRAVPAFGLAEAIAMGGTRQAVFDRCLAGQGWAE